MESRTLYYSSTDTEVGSLKYSITDDETGSPNDSNDHNGRMKSNPRRTEDCFWWNGNGKDEDDEEGITL